MTEDRISYTLKEASQVTGIGRKTLLAAIHAKVLKAVRIGPSGGKWIIQRQRLVDWLDGLSDDQADSV